MTTLARIPADVSKRLLTLACAAALAAAACNKLPEGEVVNQAGRRFVPQVADYLDNAGLGSQVTLDQDGVPYISYLMFPAKPKPGEIPVQRPVGAPFITTAATTDKPAKDGGAVGIASFAANGIWTKGAAAQSQETPAGIVVPYGPVFDKALVGATAVNTNGTDIAIGADGTKHVVWTGKDGVTYASATGTAPFSSGSVFDYGSDLAKAGPIGRPSVAVDASGSPWVAFAVDVGNAQEVRVASKDAAGDWKTQTVASVKACDGCPSPRPVRVGVTPSGPIVAYVDVSTKTVNVATPAPTTGPGNGSVWTSSPVASGVSGDGLDMAIGKDGAVFLSYYTGDGAVDVASNAGGRWSTAKVADAAAGSPDQSAEGNFMPTTGVAVDDSGALYVTWWDGDSNSVLLAMSKDGSAFTPVDTSDTQGGAYPSIAVIPDGSTVYLSWYGELNQDLRLGVLGDLKGPAVAAPSPTPSAPPAGGGTTGCGDDGKIALDEVAANILFKNTCLVAPAGQDFSVNFDNTDAGTVHNMAFSTDPSYSSPLFTGDPVTGPGKVTYDVTKSGGPLDAGTYYFRCDYHPTTMLGTLVIVAAKGK